MEKLDLRKQWKHLYEPSAKQVVLVDVPRFQFVMVDGVIEPGMAPGTSPAFQEALQALYGISYTLKFMSKLRKDRPIDYPVMALEAIWWWEIGEFDITRPEGWFWTAMMMQPDHITDEMYQAGLDQLKKKRGDTPGISRLRLESFQEGLSVQIMHIGPYATEPQTVQRMHAFAQENGYRLRGRHHEIYLGNPLRSQPEKLKTVLRQPVEVI